jgi:hypothetical protein
VAVRVDEEPSARNVIELATGDAIEQLRVAEAG